jgi:hypothetical protein
VKKRRGFPREPLRFFNKNGEMIYEGMAAAYDRTAAEKLFDMPEDGGNSVFSAALRRQFFVKPNGRRQGLPGRVRNEISAFALYFERFYDMLWTDEIQPAGNSMEIGVIYYGQTDYGREGLRKDEAADRDDQQCGERRTGKCGVH